MKKVFLAVLIVFCATALYAGTLVDPLTGPMANRDKIYPTFGTPLVQFDISGEFDARGYYWDNKAGRTDDTVTNSYMRGYLDLWPKLKVGDTQVITKIQMRDANPWAKFNSAVGSEVFDKSYDVPSTTSSKTNISVERAYIHHDFNDKFFTEVGLMNGQVWGTTFGDYLMPRWRVKFQGMTALGAVGAIYEKNAETGSEAIEDSEKDDYNAYALYGVTKLGGVTLEPLFYYHMDSAFYRVVPGVTPAGLPIPAGLPMTTVVTGQDNGSDGAKILYLSLASRGKVGPLGMEGEVTYKKTDINDVASTTSVTISGTPTTIAQSVYDTDWVEWGAYLNLWADLDVARVGAKLAYGNWDDEGGLTGTGAGCDFREDFKSNLILGDEVSFGGVGEDLIGMTLVQPYIKNVKLGMDKLTGSASFGYMMSNQKDTVYEDASAMEGDLGVQYKFTDNLLYRVDAGYAKISMDEGDDPDPIMVLKHEILLTF